MSTLSLPPFSYQRFIDRILENPSRKHSLSCAALELPRAEALIFSSSRGAGSALHSPTSPSEWPTELDRESPQDRTGRKS